MVQPDCAGVGVSLISLTVPYDFNVKQFFAIFWSLVPYAFLATMIFALFFTQRAGLLFFLFFGLIMVAINEFAVKHVHDETRPSRSCLDSGGFPSGHAMIATLFLTWMTIEVVIHPGWTWKKKTLIIIGLWCTLGPCPPFRHPGGDHSWNQIAGGVVVGFIMGLILFFFNQFVIVRNLESIMKWRLFSFLHIQNDYRPNYEQTKHKGANAPKHAYYPLFSSPKFDSNGLFHGAHLAVMAVTALMGIIGIILGEIKRHKYPNCDRSSGPVGVGVGLWTLIASIFMLLVYINAIRKRNNQTWTKEGMQLFLWLGGFFIFEGFFWNVALVETSREDARNTAQCSDRSDMTLIYAIVWFVLFAVLLVFSVEVYILLALRTVYGWPGGVSKDKSGEAASEDSVPMEERQNAPLTPNTKKMSSIQKTKSGSIIRSRSKQNI